MKNRLLALLTLAVSPVLASAQVQLVAGWDFGQFTFEGFTYTVVDDFDNLSTSLPANFSSIGSFNPVKTHNTNGTPVSAGTGSISWALADAQADRVFAVSSTNTQNRTMPGDLFIGTLMSNQFSDQYGLGLGFSGMAGKSFSVTVNLAGFADFDPSQNEGVANFSFSAAADSAVSIEWFYNSTSIGVSNIGSGYTHSAYGLDLPATFYGQESTLVGVISGNALLLLDNVQINGVTAAPIPEPSTYALLAGVGALALAAYRRRQTAQAA